MRTLSQQEINILERNRCRAEDWQKVSVGEGFSADRLYEVEFRGTCSVGGNSGCVTADNGIALPSGIRHARIINSAVGDNCLIEHVSGFIYDTDIEDNCVICNVGAIQTTEGTTFGQGNAISVMNEAGEGNVVLFSELTSQIAALTVLPPYLGVQHDDSDETAAKRRQAKEAVKRMVMEEVKRVVPKRTRIGKGARIIDTAEITNSWVGEATEIRSARRISECTLTGEPDNGVFIGAGVICDGCVVTSGSSIANNAIATNCFVGECSTLTDGFSATDSLFFANSYMANGEACAAFCGPFSVSHHKSTLLIGGMFSFYNAGSNTNFSNHAYKMGPIHSGILEHGSKTASGAHILWPAHIGAFSMCMGKITTHPDTQDLPFSYVIGDGTDTFIVPGRNIATVGTYRDITKWAKRDARPEGGRRSMTDFSWLNACTILKVAEAKNCLESILDHEGKKERYTLDDGSVIRGRSLQKGITLYSMAIRMFLAENIGEEDIDDETMRELPELNLTDISGLIINQDTVMEIVDGLLNGDIDTTEGLQEAINRTVGYKAETDKALAMKIADDIYGWQSRDTEDRQELLDYCRQARQEWIDAIAEDARKEYQLGDVDRETLDAFLSKLK